MGISSLNKMTGVSDYKGFTPFSISNGVAVAQGTTVELYSVVGSGYLASAVISSINNDATVKAWLKVTIDNNIVFHAYVSGNNSEKNNGGIVQIGDIEQYGNVPSIRVSNTYFYATSFFSGFPLNDSNAKKSIVLSQPIYFNKNLKIEVDHSWAASQNIYYEIRGGLA